MGWRQEVGSFDLSRLTLVGWLVFPISLAVGAGAAVLWVSVFPLPPGDAPNSKRPAAMVGIGAAIVFFFAARIVLQLVGVVVMRPKPAHSVGTNDQAIADLRRRMSRVGKWSLLFLLLMPLGFIFPCGIAVALMPGPQQPAPPTGITAPQIFGMIAFALPVIGLAGWLLIRGDRGKYAHALAVAEKADAMGLDFSEVPPPDVLTMLAEFRLFAAADQRHEANYCTGKVSEKRIAILEYAFAYTNVRGPGNAKAFRQTVAIIYGLDSKVPDFRLEPKGWLAKALSAFTKSPIELPGDEDFNKAFNLDGEERQEIIGALSASASDLIGKANVAVEVHQGNMVCYGQNEIAKPANYGDVIDQAVSIAKALQKRRQPG